MMRVTAKGAIGCRAPWIIVEWSERGIFHISQLCFFVEFSWRFRYCSRDTLHDLEIILIASIPDLFVGVDGNTGIESEFHGLFISTGHAILHHVLISYGRAIGSFPAISDLSFVGFGIVQETLEYSSSSWMKVRSWHETIFWLSEYCSPTP